MAKFSMRTTLLCTAGAIALMIALPVAHPASAQGLNDIVRNLNNTMNPGDAQRREDQARREDQLRREDRAHRERVGRSRNSTGAAIARSPNLVSITGTVTIEEITVTAATMVSVGSLISAPRDRPYGSLV